MGQKVSPTGLRVGIIKDWASRWFGGAKYIPYLREDLAVREFLSGRLKGMSVDSVEIERGTDSLNVIINSARPGLIIGRGGAGIEELKKALRTVVKRRVPVRVEVREVRNPEASAAIMAESIIEQIERRIPFRRIMKQTMAKIMASRSVQGAKIQMGGRLDGAEIARTEHLEEGSLPLQTIRANIDFARATAKTTYGTVGVKVWIYRGEVFGDTQVRPQTEPR